MTVPRVARVIAESDAVVIDAGPGTDVGSGLPDSGGSGVWRANRSLTGSGPASMAWPTPTGSTRPQLNSGVYRHHIHLNARPSPTAAPPPSAARPEG